MVVSTQRILYIISCGVHARLLIGKVRILGITCFAELERSNLANVFGNYLFCVSCSKCDEIVYNEVLVIQI